MAQNLPRGTPARVLVLLTLLTGVVAVSAWRDALRREKNNWVRYPTALGDTGLLQPGQLPARLPAGGEGGVYLTAARGPVLHRPDDRMYRVFAVGPDPGDGEGALLPFSLFTTRENLPEEADPKLYARTAPNQYRRLKVSVEPPADPGPAPGPEASVPVFPGDPAGVMEHTQDEAPEAASGNPQDGVPSAALPQDEKMRNGEAADGSPGGPAQETGESPDTPPAAVPEPHPARPPKAIPVEDDEADFPR